MRKTRPHLLPGDDELVSVDLSAGTERREVGAGCRLGKFLTTNSFAGKDFSEVEVLLLLRGANHECRPSVIQTDKAGINARQAGAAILLVPDQLLDERSASAAVLP